MPSFRYAEAKRHDPNEEVFLETARDVLDALAPVIDRWPKYAWVAKQLLEAERVSLPAVWFWIGLAACWLLSVGLFVPDACCRPG